MAGAAVKHDYHLVNPSPWPLVGSIGAFVMAIGAVGWMTSDQGPLMGIGFLQGPAVFAVGMAIIAYTMIGWWRDVVKESLNGESRTPVVRLGFRYGMVLFIASEVMFFVAWFWAFFSNALFPGGLEPITLSSGEAMLYDGDAAMLGNHAREIFTGGNWPPRGVETLDPWHLPLINTLILLLSGTTVTWAHHAIQHNDRSGLIQGLILTVILGACFSTLQVIEYQEAIHHGLFSFSGQIYGATFFMATGFHGFHVLVGTIFLAVCLLRAVLGQFTAEHHFGFEAAAWYWHFVDVVWLFLFACIYVWGG